MLLLIPYPSLIVSQASLTSGLKIAVLPYVL
jgi:hypothetical protein